MRLLSILHNAVLWVYYVDTCIITHYEISTEWYLWLHL